MFALQHNVFPIKLALKNHSLTIEFCTYIFVRIYSALHVPISIRTFRFTRTKDKTNRTAFSLVGFS